MRTVVVAASAALVLAVLSAGAPADHPKEKMDGAALFPAAHLKWKDGPPARGAPYPWARRHLAGTPRKARPGSFAHRGASDRPRRSVIVWALAASTA